MNKKFSTLVASLLLATAVGTVSADVTHSKVGTLYEQAAYLEGTSYLLGDSKGNVLVIEKKDAAYVAKLVKSDQADLVSSLWTIEPVTTSDNEGGLSFRFKNKRFGVYLSYNANEAYVGTGNLSRLPGNIGTWKWSKSLLALGESPLSAAFNAEKDSVVYLNTKGENIIAVKEAAGKYNGEGIELNAYISGRVRLTNDDLNSMLGTIDPKTGKVQLNFYPQVTDASKNVFTNSKYRVTPAAGENSESTGWLALTQQKVEKFQDMYDELDGAYTTTGAYAEIVKWNKKYKDNLELNIGWGTVGRKKNAYEAANAALSRTAIENALEAYDGSDEAVLAAIAAFTNEEGGFDMLDAAKAAIDENTEDIQTLEVLIKAYLNADKDAARDALDALRTLFNEKKEGIDNAVGDVNSQAETVQAAIDALNALFATRPGAMADPHRMSLRAGAAEPDFDAVQVALATLDANKQYMERVINAMLANTPNQIDVDGAVNIYFNSNPVSVSGMSVDPLAVTEAAAISATVDQVTAFMSSYLDAQVAENAKIDAQIDAAKGYEISLNTTIESLQGQVTDLQGQVDTKDAQIADLNGQIGRLENQHETDLETIADLRDQIAVLNADIADLESTIREKEALIAQYQSYVNDLDGLFTDVETSFATLKVKHAGLTTAVNELSEIPTQIDAVETALDTNDAERSAAEESLADLKAATADLQTAYTDARDNLDVLLETLKEAYAEVGVAVNDIQSAYEAYIEALDNVHGLHVAYLEAREGQKVFDTIDLAYQYFHALDNRIKTVQKGLSFWKKGTKIAQAIVDNYFSFEKSTGNYLMVDTAYMTQFAGRQYVGFKVSKFKEIEGRSDAARDINGRINYYNWYFPANDSLVLRSEGSAIKYDDTKYWLDMTNNEVRDTKKGSTVMVKVLGDNKREATIAFPEQINTSTGGLTMNTRIGLSVPDQNAVVAQIPTGVYLIKKVSYDPKYNGKYAVDNFLSANYSGWASINNQDLQHIPAAQWVIVADDNATTNSIYNRESEGKVGIDYPTWFVSPQFYKDAAGNLFTMAGDTVTLETVTDVTTPELGYKALEDISDVTDAHYTTYAFNLIDGLATGMSITADAAGKLRVSAEPTYFTVTPVDTVEYGYALDGVAEQLKRVAYQISDGDGKYVVKNNDGKYVLAEVYETDAPAFYMKEFKINADSVCHYALIVVDEEDGDFDGDKIGVDYTSALLINESLEYASNALWNNENTATFALAKKEIERYRNVTIKPAYAQFYQADNQESIILCENPENKGAGTTANPSKPTGINFLGQSSNDFSIYVDTAYVRNETKRPQFLLGLRPDFTELEVPCPEDSPEHNHPSTFVPQTAAEYLVVLNDSLANDDAAEKMYKSKEGYTRLAFVAATHRNDSLIMASDNNRIFLGNNARNNVTFQFLYAERPVVEEAEDFYIETQVGNKKGWIKILNAIPVIVDNIQDADIFNVEGGIPPVANDKISTSSISVIAVNGAVIVRGAAGKTVIISNLLGQQIANTVITSDEATIAAPKGYVTVAVEGEAAVKAIVK